jgi:hypothetical protein
MNTGLPPSRATIEELVLFMEAFEALHSARFFSETASSVRILTLVFPDEWRGLNISVKYPTASAYPDLDITIKSAVNTPTLICTRDEAMAKVFLTTAIQMFEPIDRAWGMVSPEK